MPESELQSNSGSTAAAAAAAAVAAAAAANGLVHSPTALMRPPIKHCAMHVYIAQFISDHMHHSRHAHLWHASILPMLQRACRQRATLFVTCLLVHAWKHAIHAAMLCMVSMFLRHSLSLLCFCLQSAA